MEASSEGGKGPEGAVVIHGWIEYFLGGKSDRCIGLTSYHLHMPNCLGNLGIPTFRNPEGLSGPAQGLLYLHLSELQIQGTYFMFMVSCIIIYSMK